jgi:hypothetical protein
MLQVLTHLYSQVPEIQTIHYQYWHSNQMLVVTHFNVNL